LRFSVVVPTLDRPESLRRLVHALAEQTWRDFEVIAVDQSAQPTDCKLELPIRYVRIAERGPGNARNVGIEHATGEVVAFTDDDCEPDPTWLACAHERFLTDDVVGFEGLVRSDQVDRARYRVVTNRGSVGVGFMTANLFVRRSVLEAIGGFDVRFELFGCFFREDTDLAWRAMDHGVMAGAPEVVVLHPAEPLVESRDRFFLHDALLAFKHPERYIDLVRREGHARSRGYWDRFLEGVALHGLTLPAASLAGFAPDDVLARLSSRSQQV
jgi:glycosyltransferase involved in cell wall biosynthesis